MSVEMQTENEGTEAIRIKLLQLDASLKSQIPKNLAKLAHCIENTAKQLAPVKTGHLRSTIFSQTQNWTAKIGATAHYAVFLEFGTCRIRPHKFLSTAVEMHLPRLRETLDAAVEEAISEVLRK
ncbi:MAG: HK97-gp10 family putative phage morphogenesis protein [Candidatus Bathyarchaeales archaeon]